MAGESILITGSSGTIGTALAKELIERGHEVAGVDVEGNSWLGEVDDHTVICDLADPTALDQLPQEFDIVVHLAANARVHETVKRPNKATENVLTLHNVLEYARKESIPEFIFASTREVYGNEFGFVHDETDATVSKCKSPYAASKVGGEALVQSYNECYDMNCAVLRFSNVYGKYDDSDRVVPLFLKQAAEGKTMTVYDDEKLLDFTYIDDCVDGILKSISSMNLLAGETLNIASGRGASILELAKTINVHVDPGSAIAIENNRTGEVRKFVADVSKAQKVIGYDPTHSLSEGVEKTVAWYDENGLI